jgi:uncharacterized membrane protein YphA (DoxX/SURF4 family)
MNRAVRVLAIGLRIAIGWHFLYEGVFKIQSDTGAVAYDTSWYTLQTSLARLREAPSAAAADAWYDGVVRAFKARKSLDEGQKARLGEVRDRIKLGLAEGDPTALGVDWDYVRSEVLHIAASGEGDRFTALGYLQASAGPLRPLFRSLVADVDGLGRLSTAAALAQIDDRQVEILRFFERGGRPFDDAQRRRLAKARDSIRTSLQTLLESSDWKARLSDYRLLRSRVENAKVEAAIPFVRERLAADRQKLDAMSAELLAYVNEPLVELAVQTQNIASVEQMGLGPLPRPVDSSLWVDRGIKLSLTAIGVCLLLGLFTPSAALLAVGQLMVFYVASPPWPGLPAASTGGHYLYVDRNLIEALAAALVAALFWRTRSQAAAPTAAEPIQNESQTPEEVNV